jgi:hypothetical protein
VIHGVVQIVSHIRVLEVTNIFVGRDTNHTTRSLVVDHAVRACR